METTLSALRGTGAVTRPPACPSLARGESDLRGNSGRSFSAVFSGAAGSERSPGRANRDAHFRPNARRCNGEAERWYGQLPAPALIGLEATGNSQWFVELLQKLGHEVWIGDAAQIRASYIRKQKNDKRDAAHVLKLLLEGRFPRLWVPSSEQRDLRQLLIHRHKLVQIRSRVKNGLQHLAMNRGLQKKSRLWSAAGQQELHALPLPGWAGRRQQDLLHLLAQLDQQITALDEAAQQAAEQNLEAQLLLTQPGVEPITALAFVLTIGNVSRFPRGKQVASYLGLIPREHSSGGRQRLGATSKQGNSFVRMLLVEAAQNVNRCYEGFRKQYQHRCHRKPKAVAKVQRQGG